MDEQERYQLRSGEVLRLCLGRGVTLIVTGGRLQVRSAPQWLAEQVLQLEWRLGAGDTQVLAASGWLELTAASDAELLILRPQPCWRVWSSALLQRCRLAADAVAALAAKRSLSRSSRTS
jgi:hypothetical protein